MSKWRHFSDEESEGLIEDLMFKMDRMRDFLGVPVFLTETVATGGSHVENTAHETGHACDGTIRPAHDWRPFTADEQIKIAWAAGRAGFDRVGIYDRHFHVDVDKTKPSPALWTGKSK